MTRLLSFNQVVYETCQRLSLIFLVALLIAALWIGCNDAKTPPSKNKNILRVATTTSTRDSGLTDYLIPRFEAKYNAQVRLIASGSGKAMRLGELGEVDVILVHAEEAEKKFMEANHAVRREPVMYNYFVLLGPADDPASIKDLDPVAAFAKIREKGSAFVSRGDQSGTHQREQSIWRKAQISKKWDRFLETGQGMGPSLMIASQKRAYILCDRGTYLAMQQKVDLVPHTNSMEELKNPYGVLCINPKKNSNINTRLANQFADFLIDPDTQKLLMEFTRDGEPLFYPHHPVE